MATREQLRAFITEQPFRPFVIRMTGGRFFTIAHRKTPHATPREAFVTRRRWNSRG